MSRRNSPMLYLVKSGKITGMRRRIPQAAYDASFQAKVKLARIGSGYSAQDMAHALGITKDKYYRYESRHMMRHDLIPLFCRLTNTDVDKMMAAPVGQQKSAAVEAD